MMKSSFMRYSVLLLLIAAVIGSCSKDKTPSDDGNSTSFLQYISTEPDLKIFKAAFDRSGMQADPDYVSGGPYTFFIPVDSAFNAQQLTVEVINSKPKEELLKMLKYMIVKGRISSATLAGFFRQSAATLSSDRPLLTKNYYGIYFNGIPMKQANINISDAVVHKMTRVALPPSLTAKELIDNTPELSIFAAAIEKTWNIRPEGFTGTTRSMMQTNGKTIFAPVNEAMIRYGLTSVEEVNNLTDEEQIAKLAALVAKHVNVLSYADDPAYIFDNSPSSYTVSDFKGGFYLNNLGGYGRGVTVREDGLTLRTILNIPDIRIIRTDLLCSNGIVQIIDQTILLQ